MTNGLLQKPPSIAAMHELLLQLRMEAYLVGGYVRDSLLGRESPDIDMAVRGDALYVARTMAEELGGRFVLLDRDNNIGRVVFNLPKGYLCLDISSYADSIESDLARRDFSVDAMAVEVSDWIARGPSARLIDPYQGRADADARLLRAIGDSVFRDDPVRLLRVLRLGSELGLRIEQETELLIRRDATLVASVPGERVREELVRILNVSGAAGSLVRMHQMGLLLAVFPELTPASGFEQNGAHTWDVLTHSLNTVLAAEYLIRQGDWEYGPEDLKSGVEWPEETSAHFAGQVGHGSTRATMLKLAALFHDVAKPQTKSVHEGGKWHFYGHPQVGAALVRSALERLRFSNREIELVETEVLHHLRPAQMTQGDVPTRRAVYRYFRDTGGAGRDVFFLALADYLATYGPRLDSIDWERQTGLMRHVFAECRRQGAETTDRKLIDGHDMIVSFGLVPGPHLGALLAAVEEAQAAGEISTREEALALVQRQIESGGAS
ncbi:MAG: HD domain-containing protein [Dehalococcoidia bacterium]|nr:HD domain-containing protein [Dehalococcoidia bacterium]